MSSAGIGLLTLHYLIYAGIVLGRRLRSSSSVPDTFPALYSFSWGLQTCTATVALFITLVYWIVLHPFVVENNLIQGESVLSGEGDFIIDGEPLRNLDGNTECFPPWHQLPVMSGGLDDHG